MPLVKIKGNFQVTIPASIRKKWDIAVGDYFKVEESGNGILLKPVRFIESGESTLRPQRSHDEASGSGRTEAHN